MRVHGFIAQHGFAMIDKIDTSVYNFFLFAVPLPMVLHCPRLLRKTDGKAFSIFWHTHLLIRSTYNLILSSR